MGRILLIDDDPELLPLIEHILLGGGHKVTTAETFAGAMTLLEREAHDLVLTDGRLGDGNGLDVADAASARGIKTLIFTGYASQFPRERLERHPYLWKPVRAMELLEAVSGILGERRC